LQTEVDIFVHFFTKIVRKAHLQMLYQVFEGFLCDIRHILGLF